MAKLTIDEFNSKLANKVKYSLDNKARLLINGQNLDKMNQLYGDVDSPGTWLGDWPLYTDKGKCPHEIKQSIEKLKPEITNVFSAICDDIPKSIWTDADRNMYGRKTGAKKKPTKPPKIEKEIVPSMKSLGGGLMKCANKTTTAQKRAALPKGATGVQIAYSVVDHPVKNPPPAANTKVETTTVVTRQTVDTADDCEELAYFPGATFELELDLSDAGRELQYFLRWYNAKHIKNAGSWCGPFSANI